VNAKKSWDVCIDTFLNVLLPADVDPDTEEGRAQLVAIATQRFIDALRYGDAVFTWERYPDGDEPQPIGETRDCYEINAEHLG
jgi:hypothetical protein